MRKSSLSVPYTALFLLLILAGVPTPAPAQEAASVWVVVRAAETGQALPGAQVVVHGLGLGGVTGPEGRVQLQRLQPGTHSIEARHLGYTPQAARVVVEEGKAVQLLLALPVQPIRLAEVRVRPRPSLLRRTGFYDRRQGGFGVFMTRDEIERMNPRFMSDVLRRVAGISLTSTGFGGTSRAAMRGVKVLGSCPIQYYIDGTMTNAFNIDELTPSDVEGIEIYRGASTIPPAYNKGTALCGVILVWTRVD